MSMSMSEMKSKQKQDRVQEQKQKQKQKQRQRQEQKQKQERITPRGISVKLALTEPRFPFLGMYPTIILPIFNRILNGKALPIVDYIGVESYEWRCNWFLNIFGGIRHHGIFRDIL